MTDHARWSIEELLVRYDLEPQLADVFVEGAFDKEILSEVFANKSREAAFYEIDSVDIPADILARHDLTLGNKQRVIALSRALESLDENARVRCLVDRDLDHWFADIEDTVRLRWTKFCALESHFISEETVTDLVIKTACARVTDAKTLVESIYDVLKALYAMRLAARQLALSLKWVALRKYLGRDGDSLWIDTDRYIVATLGANGVLGQKSAFELAVNAWRGRLNCDVRLASRGHDYSELLGVAISEFGGHKAFAQQSAMERLFVLLAKSVSSLEQELD